MNRCATVRSYSIDLIHKYIKTEIITTVLALLHEVNTYVLYLILNTCLI